MQVIEYEVTTTFIPVETGVEETEILTFDDKGEATEFYEKELEDVDNGYYEGHSKITSVVLEERVYEEISCTPLQRKDWK